ncbi:MAG: hypothetical protein FGM39_10585 [Phycisphaerales bacterium]|nr:hypothetical protein [Phycisphaerales bacterium]
MSARRTWSFATRLAVKRAQFAMARALGSVPIVTYATWRTASTSVHHAIRASGRRAAVKAHAIHRPNIGGARLSVLAASSRPTTHVGDWAVHRHVLSGNRRADWVVMVRDPLAMALSRAALAARARHPGIPADEVMDRLLAEAPVGGLDWWLEHDMRPALGWCALDVPFDRDLGWAESECSHGRVLVLRADLPDVHKDEVLSRFLGARVRVVPNNDARSGGRGSVLDALIRRLEVHPAILATSLSQRSARHFWREEQLVVLRARWLPAA